MDIKKAAISIETGSAIGWAEIEIDKLEVERLLDARRGDHPYSSEVKFSFCLRFLLPAFMAALNRAEAPES